MRGMGDRIASASRWRAGVGVASGLGSASGSGSGSGSQSEPESRSRPGAEARPAELARSRGALRWVLARLASALIGGGAGRGPKRAAARGSQGGLPGAHGPKGGSPGWDPLGYVRADDYARERLGLSGRSLQDLARVGRALAGLPRLEVALTSGALTWSQVRLLARFVGPDDEAHWIAFARGTTARQLERRVRAVDRGALGCGAPNGDALDCDEDGYGTEPHETVPLRVGSALCFKWPRTRRWAARVAGEPATPGAALEMITAEAISALPPGAAAGADLGLGAGADRGGGAGADRGGGAAPADPDGSPPRGPNDHAAANVCARKAAAVRSATHKAAAAVTPSGDASRTDPNHSLPRLAGR